MKKINYKKLYFLLGQIPGAGISMKERLEIWVSSASGGRTTHVSELDELEYRTMLLNMEESVRALKPEALALDKWRKRVIGATCRYHRLMGYYKDLPADERVKKAKGEASKAKGAPFNSITVTELQALYNAKIRQNRILEKANEKFEKDLLD